MRDVKNAILDGADVLPQLATALPDGQQLISGGRRLNAYNALAEYFGDPSQFPRLPPELSGKKPQPPPPQPPPPQVKGVLSAGVAVHAGRCCGPCCACLLPTSSWLDHCTTSRLHALLDTPAPNRPHPAWPALQPPPPVKRPSQKSPPPSKPPPPSVRGRIPRGKREPAWLTLGGKSSQATLQATVATADRCIALCPLFQLQPPPPKPPRPPPPSVSVMAARLLFLLRCSTP